MASAATPTTDPVASLPQPQLPVASDAPCSHPPPVASDAATSPRLPVASVAPSSPQPQPQQQPQPLSPTSPAKPTPDSSLSSPRTNRAPEMHKNRLQEYTQRAGMQLPIYNILNEGLQHAPRFRATVVVDGVSYTSPSTFLHRKEAEQDVAKLALQCISRKARDGGIIPIHEVSVVFCKSALNEFAAKMSLQKPVYDTDVSSNGTLPLFVSSVSFNGSTYTGVAGKSKKEAEQLAAHAAIKSLLGDSNSRMVLSDIIKSKAKLQSSMDKVNDVQSAGNNLSPLGGNKIQGLEHLPDKGKEAASLAATENNVLNIGVTELSAASFTPYHVFEKPNQLASSGAINLPVNFVQPNQVNDAFISGKRKRKNKKKPNKKPQIVNPLAPYAVMPLNQAPSCAVGQFCSGKLF